MARPSKGCLQKHRFNGSEKALAGVRNAPWDLVYITAWFERIKTQSEANEFTVLCSKDRVFLNVAELLRSAVLDGTMPPFEQAGFGTSVSDRYNSYIWDLSNPKRALTPLPADFENYRDKLVSNLEGEFLKRL